MLGMWHVRTPAACTPLLAALLLASLLLAAPLLASLLLASLLPACDPAPVIGCGGCRLCLGVVTLLMWFFVVIDINGWKQLRLPLTSVPHCWPSLLASSAVHIHCRQSSDRAAHLQADSQLACEAEQNCNDNDWPVGNPPEHDTYYQLPIGGCLG